MEDIFTVIGRLYVDVYNSQKVIEMLQQQIKDKDKELEDLRKLRDRNE